MHEEIPPTVLFKLRVNVKKKELPKSEKGIKKEAPLSIQFMIMFYSNCAISAVCNINIY